MTSARRRLIANELCEDFDVSQRRVSRALDLARSSLRYAPVFRDEEAALARRIEELAGAHPRFGYRRIWALLDREGWTVNKKAVRRLYRESGLKVAQPRANPKPRREHGQDGNACHLRPSRGKDDVWTWDFIFDRTSDGRSLKWLSVVDEYTRECLVLEARRGMTAEDIRIILAEVAARRGGPPCRMRSDNGLRGAVHRAGEPVAERLRGVVSQQASRRVPEPRGIRERIAGRGVGRALEGGVQYRTPAQFPALQDPGRVFGDLCEVCAYR
jgi:putative transposase